MTVTPFALVNPDDQRMVFAYGMDIELPSGREAVTFRREASGQPMIGVHGSAEAAHRRFSMVTPLDLIWEPGCRCCLCFTTGQPCDDTTCDPEPPSGEHPNPILHH
ncbi:hypothetical protein BLA60_05460 [Actinophytocola xinjiangensis]|uniref:Uncharacterized protein n=1 Tax=Actinophytocola xinjiangensis TaxID=485602 RepID=A0A7Z1AZY9_9PSEU|nr:hypothetical protein [Actinophytocola xinjiangensis]OLF12726.1 hypothetical protein BLA60_05460 [Actinophytocola xinjiangensis]